MDSNEAEGDNISEELSKIKGDAIGDTVYSERWVLKTLMRLAKLEEEPWDKNLEEQLQLLWDMTAEKDVAMFLHVNDFLSLCHKIIIRSTVPRLSEIVIGILGNMCCEDLVKAKLAESPDVFLSLIEQLQCQDSLTLIQLLRLFNTCLWKDRDESRYSSPSHDSEPTDSPWLKLFGPHLEFIINNLTFYLTSATNDALICCSIELLDTLLSTKLNISNLLVTSPDLVARLSGGLAECLWQLLRGVVEGDSVTDTRKLFRGCRVWVNVVGVLASSQLGRNHLGSKMKSLTKSFIKLLELFLQPGALQTHELELPLDVLSLLECLPRTPLPSSVLINLITAVYNLQSGLNFNGNDDEEPSEAEQLLQRTAHFVRIQITLTDDLSSVLSELPISYLAYLEDVLQPDDSQINRLKAALLRLRTNGLVQ